MCKDDLERSGTTWQHDRGMSRRGEVCDNAVSVMTWRRRDDVVRSVAMYCERDDVVTMG